MPVFELLDGGRFFERAYTEQGVEIARVSENADGTLEVAGHRMLALTADEVADLIGALQRAHDHMTAHGGQGPRAMRLLR